MIGVFNFETTSLTFLPFRSDSHTTALLIHKSDLSEDADEFNVVQAGPGNFMSDAPHTNLSLKISTIKMIITVEIVKFSVNRHLFNSHGNSTVSSLKLCNGQ